MRLWRRRLGSAAPLAANLLRRKSHHKAQRIAAVLEAPPGLARSYSSYRGLFTPRETTVLLRHWGFDPEPLTADLNPPSHMHILDRVAWLEGSHYLGKTLTTEVVQQQRRVDPAASNNTR